MARTDGSNLSKESIEELRNGFSGEIIVKGEVDEAKYKTLIDRWNKIHIKQANIVVLPRNERDVSTALRFVAKYDIDLAIAGGRHTMAGTSSTTGMVIDLRKIKDVKVDKATKTVVAGGGCIAGDVESACEAEGLMVPFGVHWETGVGGLTTGGGIGFLTGEHGLTLDNLLSARVAVADGRVVVASDEENVDLFWGIRGGGCNFGIVTEFTYRAHDQGKIMLGIFPFPMDRLIELVDFFASYYDLHFPKANGKLLPMLALMTTSPDVPHMPTLLAAYNGTEEEAQPFFEPFEKLAPLQVQKMYVPYTQLTQINKMMPTPPDHNRVSMSSAFMDRPYDTEIILTSINQFLEEMKTYGASAYRSTWVVEMRDYRVVCSKPFEATAYANRFDTALVGAEFIYNDPALDAKMRETTLSLMGNIRDMVVKRRASGKVPLPKDQELRDPRGTYANYNNGLEKIESVFGKNLPRLRDLKRKWDPTMIFDKWYAVTPAEA